MSTVVTCAYYFCWICCETSSSGMQGNVGDIWQCLTGCANLKKDEIKNKILTKNWKNQENWKSDSRWEQWKNRLRHVNQREKIRRMSRSKKYFVDRENFRLEFDRKPSQRPKRSSTIIFRWSPTKSETKVSEPTFGRRPPFIMLWYIVLFFKHICD